MRKVVLIESEPVYETRRATGEDLAGLHDLWTRADLPWKELQPRFGEFYIVTKGETICAAVGLQRVKQQAFIHSEAYVHPRAAELLRPILWERVLNVVQNHGAARLWVNRYIRNYERCGFVPPDEESCLFFPKEFGVVSRRWRVMKLRDEAPDSMMEEMFQIDHEARKVMRRSRRHAAAISSAACMIALMCLTGFVLLLLMLGRH